MAELDAYRRRLALLRYRYDAGEMAGLAEEAKAYVAHLTSLEEEAPAVLHPNIVALIVEYEAFVAALNESSQAQEGLAEEPE